MKKIYVCIINVCVIATLILLLNGCMAAYYSASYPKGKVECDVSVRETNLINDREAVEFNIIPSSYGDGDFISIYVKNNTNDRIYIEWENARCNSGRVVFDDDRRITMNNAKQDEAISAYGYSLTKHITSQSYVLDDYLLPLYKKDDLIKGLRKNVYLLMPIKFSDGKVIDYHVTIEYRWEAEPSNEE